MIHTKVAKIIDPTTVILAAGAESGVKDGMEFVIYDLTETIRDPDTGDDLGQLEIVKGTVRAVHVQEKITLARTKSRTVQRVVEPLGGIAEILGTSIYAKRTVTQTEWDQLKIAEQKAIPSTAPVDLTVRVGDRVRTVYQPEYATTESVK
jgi:hypothetical protein